MVVSPYNLISGLELSWELIVGKEGACDDVVTLRSGQGGSVAFAATRTKYRFAPQTLVFCPRFAPSFLADRFSALLVSRETSALNAWE
jgi:hypothetical protein